jgi:[ribosomal protein S18]-alanine N-acetyltransferase
MLPPLERDDRTALEITPLRAGDAAAIASWRYPPPYDVYDGVDSGDTAPSPEVFALREAGELIGFCSFGADARVPGGSYPEGPLDIGLGIRPDRTGQRRGADYLAAAVAFARDELGATRVRATVAEFNARALRLCERAGFRRLIRFDGRDRPYWILVR